MEDTERRKRSRFDQTEPEPKRASRFDRRSRSPPAKRNDTGRDRSPISSKARDSATPDAKSPVDPAAAAGKLPWHLFFIWGSRMLTTGALVAAAAARINAQLQARKGIQHVDVPAVKSTTPDPASRSTAIAHNIGGEIYVADGDYIKDIEINDLRNRYLVTRGSAQKMVNIPRLFQLMTTQSSVEALAFTRPQSTHLCEDSLAYASMIARTGPTSFATADLACLI